MATLYSPKVVTDGLVSALDAGNTKSYISGSTILYNLVGTNVSGSLVSGNQFSTGSGGAVVLSGSANYLQINNYNFNTLASSSNFTVIFVARKTHYGVSGNNIGNSTLFQGAGNGFDAGWRIFEESEGTPGTVFSGRHGYRFQYPQTRFTLLVQDTPNTYRNTFVAFSISPTTTTGFCNGNFTSANTPVTTYPTASNSGRISFVSAGVGSWEGPIYMVQVYDRALSRDEILQNYNAVRSRFGI